MNAQPAASPPHGQLGVSEALRRFTEEYPYERGPILHFVMQVARATPPDAAVLDLGAGESPYRELFTHARYTTSDWTGSPHAGGRRADIIAPGDALPVADASFDLVICTQVLEHVSEPGPVLDECFRVLTPRGRLAVTVPLLWELHELPHDYYRYTEGGLRYLLTKAGFAELEIEPRGDGFTTLAQLMLNLGWAMGDAPDGLTGQRIEARVLLQRLASEVATWASLDAKRIMPLGYCATGRRP